MKDPFTLVNLDEVKDKKDFLVAMADALEEKGTLLSRVTVRETSFRPADEITKTMILSATYALANRYSAEFDVVTKKADAYISDLIVGGNFRPFTLTEVNQQKYPNACFVASYMALAFLAEMVVQ